MDKLAKLYHAPPSYYSMIARLVLIEKGVAFESRKIDIHLLKQQNSLAYAKINPNLTVPTLVADTSLCSSLDILNYVSKKMPGMHLEAANKTLMDEMITAHYQVEIEDLTMGKFFKTRPKMQKKALAMLEKVESDLLLLAKNHPDLSQPLIKKAKLTAKRREKFSPENIESTYFEAKQQALTFLEKMNTQLNLSPYLAGDKYSLADIVATPFLARLEMINHLDLMNQFPKVKSYYANLKKRPSFKKADIWSKVKPSFFVGLFLHQLKIRLFNQSSN